MALDSTSADSRNTTTGPITATTKTVTTKSVVTSIKKRKARNRNLWIIGIILIVGIGLLAFFNSKKEHPLTVQTEKVSKRTITEVVQATGKIQPEVQVKVSPEVPGEIVELPVKEGDHVNKGQLLAKIKPTTYQAQYQQSLAGLSAAKAQVEQQKANLINAKQQLERGKALFEKKLASAQEVESLQAAFDAAEATSKASKFNADASESQSDQIKESLNKTSVLAPMTGVVTALISQLGEKVVGTQSFAGTEMMTVSDLGVMNAMVDVDENDVVNIKIHDHVKVSVDAFPKQVFDGEVIEVANSAKLKGQGTQDQSTNFTVKIRLRDFGAADLRPGMSCTARIETVTHENVLSVPLMAVTRRVTADQQKADSIKAAQEKNKGVFHENEETPTVVFVLKAGKVKSAKVKIGISDNNYVEILSGLTGDEEIVKGNYKAVSKELDDDKAVKVDNNAKSGETGY